MSFDRHSPLSRIKDHSELARLERYDKAIKMAIVTHDRNVFESLSDILVLMNEVKQLSSQVSQLKAEIENLKCPG